MGQFPVNLDALLRLGYVAARKAGRRFLRKGFVRAGGRKVQAHVDSAEANSGFRPRG